MIEFHWPWIFLLLPAPLFVLGIGSSDNNRGIEVPPKLHQGLSVASASTAAHRLSGIWRWLLLSITWLCLLTAVAQPHKPESTALQTASGRSLVIAADLSESMSKTDFTIDNNTVNRLAVVKTIAGRFISGRSGDRLGLVLFGDEAFIGSALSFDLKSVNDVLQSAGIGMAGKSTAIGDALGLAIQVLRHDTASEKAIILLSDGTNLSGSAEPEDAAELAAKLSIRVHTIGLGSDENISAGQLYLSSSADLDESTLQAIAEASGGQFFRARTTEELQKIYSVLDELESTDEVAPPIVIHRDYRNLFIFALLLTSLLLLATRAVRL